MTSAAELHQLGNGDFIWQGYEPAVKADLFSTGLATASGTYLIDPIALNDAALRGSPVLGIIVTNANHARAAAQMARHFSAPLYAHRGACGDLPDTEVTRIAPGTVVIPGLEIIAINGAAAGEIAIYRDDPNGGTLVIGDAVINSGSYGFTVLPAKYCSSPKLLRQSLRQLPDHAFERIFFAHGTPILSHGRSRLADLLAASN